MNHPVIEANTYVSTFKNAFDTVPVNVLLSDVLDRIRDDERLKKDVLALRRLRERDKDAYKTQKTRLPAATFAGIFETRDAEHFVTPSGLMVCDIDGITDAPGVRELVGCDQHVKAAFVSITGTAGVKFLVAIPPVSAHQFHLVFAQVATYFQDVYGLELDASGKDAPRLCFLSHDPDIIVNDDKNVTPFEIDLTLETPVNQALTGEKRGYTFKIKALDTTVKSVTAHNDPTFRSAVLQVLSESAGVVNQYEAFFRVLAACKREGVTYEVFDAICKNSAGYNETQNLKAWATFNPAKTRLDASGQPMQTSTFGTLYALATQTDAQRERLNSLLPHGRQEEYTVNDDMILQAARSPRAAREGEKYFVKRAVMPDNAWMSDMPVNMIEERTELNAPCNYGKTASIITHTQDAPEQWVTLLTPVTPLRSQVARDYPDFCEVQEGDEFREGRRYSVCTREKFNASYPAARLDKTLVVIDEVHLNTLDIAYKSSMLASLQAKLDHCRTLELTGTPIRFPHHAHVAIRFQRPSAQPIQAAFLFYTDTLPVIHALVKRNAARGCVPVFFLNSKEMIQEAGEMLKSYVDVNTSEKRPYLVYRDDITREITPDARVLQDTAAVPSDCLCILTTSLFEVGINIHSHVGTVCAFPRHKDHASRRQMLAVHLPCEIVQSASRFRQGFDDLLIALPSFQRFERAAFDYEQEYFEHAGIATDLLLAYNRQQRAAKHYRHVATVRADIMPEHRNYVRRDDKGAFVYYEQGIDYLLMESLREHMTNDPVFYAQELASEFTPVIISRIERLDDLLTPEERETAGEICERIKDASAVQWEQELDRLARPETVLSQDGNVSRAERWVLSFSRYVGKDHAVSLVRQTGDQPQKLNTLQRQARREKYLATRERVKVSTFDRIDAIVRTQDAWQSRDFMKAVAPILRRDPFLCAMLTTRNIVTKWTPNRATRILESFAGVEEVITKQDGATTRLYQIVTLTPFADAVLKATGTELKTCYDWQKFCQVETLETPVNQALTGEKRGYTFKIKALDTTVESVTVKDPDAWWLK